MLVAPERNELVEQRTKLSPPKKKALNKKTGKIKLVKSGDANANLVPLGSREKKPNVGQRKLLLASVGNNSPGGSSSVSLDGTSKQLEGQISDLVSFMKNQAGGGCDVVDASRSVGSRAEAPQVSVVSAPTERESSEGVKLAQGSEKASSGGFAVSVSNVAESSNNSIKRTIKIDRKKITPPDDLDLVVPSPKKRAKIVLRRGQENPSPPKKITPVTWEEPAPATLDGKLGKDVRGTVKFYNSKTRFGFITRDDDDANVYVHRNNISKVKKNLYSGEKVLFDVVLGKKGRTEARNVRHFSREFSKTGGKSLKRSISTEPEEAGTSNRLKPVASSTMDERNMNVDEEEDDCCDEDVDMGFNDFIANLGDDFVVLDEDD